jgi:hypothetical protein
MAVGFNKLRGTIDHLPRQSQPSSLAKASVMPFDNFSGNMDGIEGNS